MKPDHRVTGSPDQESDPVHHRMHVQSRPNDRSHTSGCRHHGDMLFSMCFYFARAGQEYTTVKQLDLEPTLVHGAPNSTAV